MRTNLKNIDSDTSEKITSGGGHCQGVQLMQETDYVGDPLQSAFIMEMAIWLVGWLIDDLVGVITYVGKWLS